jgi:hypothetical protein
VTDLLIRDVPDDVVAAIDADAVRLGLSRTEYAERAGRTVLHVDKDFELIAEVTAQPLERLRTN